VSVILTFLRKENNYERFALCSAQAANKADITLSIFYNVKDHPRFYDFNVFSISRVGERESSYYISVQQILQNKEKINRSHVTCFN